MKTDVMEVHAPYPLFRYKKADTLLYTGDAPCT